MPSGPAIGSPVAWMAVLFLPQFESSVRLSGGSNTRSKPTISVEIKSRSRFADAISSAVQPRLNGVYVESGSPGRGAVLWFIQRAQYSPSIWSNEVTFGSFLSIVFQTLSGLFRSNGAFGSF